MSATQRISLLSAALLLAATGVQAQETPQDLSDPEVAHVAVTANTIDIELGKLAQARARNDDVRQFATTMVTDHSAVNEQAAALAGKLGVTPKDNAVSKSLLSGAREARESIEKQQGAAFDSAYIDREVAYHEAVIQALDGLLIPTTENAQLKKLLVDVRPAFVAHLAHARQIKGNLVSAK